SEMSSTITITGSDNGRTLTHPVGYELTMKSDSSGSALDISGYDEKVIAQLGSSEQYQLQRTLKMLKVGQTALAVVITPGCAIPKEDRVRCLVASQQILLTIVVK
ncbi:MAG: hypothetical protein NUV80_03110, partial [Candidatus Berkelbacteria bacterium]|nr:hypothetical protein [Candidatus Berkelbacteria bacterium]